MPSLLKKVRTTMAIHAHRHTHGILDGGYRSIFRGKSLDFDDLRDYVPGDEIRDIDWKATARHGSPLVRRYVAHRKHTVGLVVDTGRNMAAVTPSGELKKDLAIAASGVIGCLATDHGDLVGLVAGNAEHTRSLPARGGEAHLENLLRFIDAEVSLQAPDSDLAEQLRFIVRSTRRRMLLFVVADDRALGMGDDRLLRRLRAQHEIIWLSLDDADLMDPQPETPWWDVADGSRLPAALRDDAGLRRAYANAMHDRRMATGDMLRRLGIASERVGSEAQLIPQLLRLLEGHRHVQR
ncbi:DUF58 domain-containing protein [Saxibacter everestensis]|uniref:DUF58 domain-containing protein n=1 Tax=Saxibacter everestensis TaxID=2909229 RepID=A0ABY8QR20_9MICO|nr:DUF58 domain-containing protein [Brevibacteriaceae bacterium ZFBP1038]